MKLGSKHSEETRRKIKLARAKQIITESHKENIRKALIGKKHTAEQNRKQSEAEQNRYVSKKTRQKIRMSLLGRHHSEDTLIKMRARRHTEEQKKLISKSLKGHCVSKLTRQKISKSERGKFVSEETRKKLRIVRASQIITEETKRKLSIAFSGSKHPNWMGGKSFEPYGVEFDDKLKEQIRARDNYCCQECGKHQSELRTKNGEPYLLLVHHTDYCKTHNFFWNLISLCRDCHLKTNFNREYWTSYFQQKLANQIPLCVIPTERFIN